jgi:hypothetical protein
MTSKYRYIGTGNERSLVISDVDALWAMRMCVGEGGHSCTVEKASAMLWAMAYRYLLKPARFWRKPFYKLLRSFSQPINPAWMAGGRFVMRYLSNPIKWHRTKEAVSLKRQNRRAYYCSLKLSDIPTQIKITVIAFKAGKLSVPFIFHTVTKQRISNWASLQSTPELYPWGLDINGDWFFEDEKLLPGSIEVVND